MDRFLVKFKVLTGGYLVRFVSVGLTSFVFSKITLLLCLFSVVFYLDSETNLLKY